MDMYHKLLLYMGVELSIKVQAVCGDRQHIVLIYVSVSKGHISELERILCNICTHTNLHTIMNRITLSCF